MGQWAISTLTRSCRRAAGWPDCRRRPPPPPARGAAAPPSMRSPTSDHAALHSVLELSRVLLGGRRSGRRKVAARGSQGQLKWRLGFMHGMGFRFRFPALRFLLLVYEMSGISDWEKLAESDEGQSITIPQPALDGVQGEWDDDGGVGNNNKKSFRRKVLALRNKINENLRKMSKRK